jgi:drug/metabolite transporter (DMT)-like permease
MGFLVALLSAACSTAKDIVSKSLASKVHADVSTFASFLFAIPFYLLVMAIASLFGVETLSYTGSFFALVLVRSITDVFAEGFKMKAFAAGDISLVTSFMCLSPLILALISPFITGDKVTTHDFIALGFIVAGSLLLVRRDKTTGKVIQLKALVYAFLASVAFALNSCFDRLAVVNSGALLSGFAMTFMAGVFCLPMFLRHRGAPLQLKSFAKPFLWRGGWETLFMVSKLFALTLLEAHVVLGITRISLFFSVIAGRVMFGEQDTKRRLFGAVCMYAGLAVLLWQHLW